MASLATASPIAAPARFAHYAWAVLGYNLFVILWGAYVRATGSGAGCGSHWPLCDGMVVPRSARAETLIEFTHRATSGLDLLLVAGLLAWAFRAFPRGHLARRGAAWSAVFLVTEALLGASLVLLEHTARNTSAARGYSLSIHMANTLALLAALSLTAWWAPGRGFGRRPWTLAVAALFVLVNVSGVIAALGDTLFPARSLAEGLRADFSPSAHVFVRLRLLHPLLAAASAAAILAAALAVRTRLAGTVAALLALQMGVGLANLVLLAPVALQLAHLLVADALWIAFVLMAMESRASPLVLS